MDVRAYKQRAWDQLVENRNRWTVPVTSNDIQSARQGSWQIVLTPRKPVPRSWFPDLPGTKTLCLASGGGQQGPILAAAGAKVTVLDSSNRQLEQDRLVRDRDGLSLETVQGDVADLCMFADASFDLIVHPCSNSFVPDARPVWRECFRVLGPDMILDKGQPLESGHTLEDQIGGQLDAGFVITGFYEDRYDDGEADPLSKHLATFAATGAVKSQAG